MRQHYVPRHLLKQFSVEESDDILWCYDKWDQRQFQVSVSNIALQNDFYDGPQEDPKMESWLSALEGKVTGHDGALFQLIDDKDVAGLSARGIYTLAIYISVQELRTKLWRDRINDSVAFLENAFGEEMEQNLKEQVEEFQTEESLREFQNDFLKKKSGEAASLMTERLAWAVIENKTDHDLWLSDHPVIRYNTKAGSQPGGMGLLSKGIEIFFPLTPDLYLHMLDKNAYKKVVEYLPQCIVDEEVIIFLNDMQTQNSRRHIFSRSDDFSLVEKRLEDTPEVGQRDRDLSGAQLGIPKDAYRQWDTSYYDG
jgi:hypothetical protein